ncbi:MAG: YCF48-related protein [Terriglobia bacterium]|jgi:hypothetical protein
MWGVPKIVLERLKGKTVASQDNRQSTVENRPFEHPDANLLTAFLERTLTERERTLVLNHLAGCAECREIAALSLPTGAEAAEPASLRARSAWSVRPVFRWGALAAALGAVVVVAVLHQHPRSMVQNSSNSAPATIVANARENTPQAPQPLPSQPTSKAAARRTKGKSLESAGEMAELKKSAAPPPARQLATPSADLGARAQTPPGTQLRPPAAPAVPPPSYSQSAELSGAVNTDLARAAAKPGAVMDQPPVPVYDKKGLAGEAGASTQVRVNALQAKLPAAAFRSPMKSAAALPSALWTISADGKVQRSADGGRSWENAGVDDKVEFRVVQSNGKEIWAGGTGGALYHSSNGGATWTRVSLVSGAAPVTEAIVSINCSSSDPQHITVKTASGEQWISDDSGQLWRVVTSEE